MVDETTLRYEPETGKLFRVRELATSKPDGSTNNIWFGDRQHPAARVIFRLMTGRWPHLGMVIDHIDRDPTNNKWENLREVTHAQNMRNVVRDTRQLNRDEGMGRGVQKRGERYMVSISGFYVGMFDTVEEANAASLEFRKDFHKEFMPKEEQV